MKELVTIQVGDYANFVGSHFWNFQDELLGLTQDPDADPVFKSSMLDMDVLYRAGETHQGMSTYCPRLISIGSRGSLGSLNLSSYSYRGEASAAQMDVLTWTGNVERSVSKPLEQNLFLQSLTEEEMEISNCLTNNGDTLPTKIDDKDRVECLEHDVKFWTDYSKVQYHPRSLFELSGSWNDIDESDNYGTGLNVVAEWSHMEEMTDRLRYFAEECDHMQGIQLVVDDSGRFANVADEYLENIADDYNNVPVLLYTIRDPSAFRSDLNQKNVTIRALHDAVSFSKLTSCCNLMVPAGLPSLSYGNMLLALKDEKLFHTSAVYAAALHSITLPLRYGPLSPTTNSADFLGSLDVGEMVHTLTGQGRQNMVAVLDVSMPAPHLTGLGKSDNLHRSLFSLTPEIKDDSEDLHSVESLIIHGALDSGGCRASAKLVKEAVCAGYNRNLKFSHLSVAQCPLPIPLPFPAIFSGRVGRKGEIRDAGTDQCSRTKGSLDVDSVPMAARLRSSSAIEPFIEARLANLNRYGIARGARGAQILSDWGFGKEEIEELRERLSKMLQAFSPPCDGMSDSD